MDAILVDNGSRAIYVTNSEGVFALPANKENINKFQCEDIYSAKGVPLLLTDGSTSTEKISGKVIAERQKDKLVIHDKKTWKKLNN